MEPIDTLRLRAEPLEPAEFLAHRAFLRRLARGLLADRARAEDLVQDTFLAAQGGAPRGPARAWLAGILRNLAWKSARTEARRAARESQVEPAGDGPGADEVEIALEAERRVVAAVQALDEPYRRVIVLRYYGDLGPSAIAERIGAPVETVKTRLKRALALLREKLAEPDDGGSPMRGLVLLAGAASEALPLTAAAIVLPKLLLAGGIAAGLVAVVGWSRWKPAPGEAPVLAGVELALPAPDAREGVTAPRAPAEADARAAVQTPGAAAYVTGSVARADGGALDEVLVGLVLLATMEAANGQTPCAPGHWTRCDAAGRYRLWPKESGPSLVVAAVAPSAERPLVRPASARVAVGRAGDVELAPLLLELGETLAGKVLLVDDTPPPPGRLYAGLQGNRMLALGTARLAWTGESFEHAWVAADWDDAGRFEMRGLAPRSYGLSTLPPGLPSLHFEDVVARLEVTAPRTDVLHYFTSFHVELQVLVAGRPLGGASVTTIEQDWMQSTMTDDAGRIAISIAARRTLVCEIVHPRFERQRLELPPEKLWPGAKIEVHLTGARQPAQLTLRIPPELRAVGSWPLFLKFYDRDAIDEAEGRGQPGVGIPGPDSTSTGGWPDSVIVNPFGLWPPIERREDGLHVRDLPPGRYALIVEPSPTDRSGATTKLVTVRYDFTLAPGERAVVDWRQ